MSIVLRFNPKDVTRQKYDEVIRRLEAAGEWPHPPGLEFYVLWVGRKLARQPLGRGAASEHRSQLLAGSAYWRPQGSLPLLGTIGWPARLCSPCGARFSRIPIADDPASPTGDDPEAPPRHHRHRI